MAAVSIIVPVYNAEAYLERCIDSILSQSCPDIEVLLIDDGSTDSSFKICLTQILLLANIPGLSVLIGYVRGCCRNMISCPCRNT